MSKRWYVVVTQPHSEGRAQSNLRRQRYECVWLRFREQKVRRGKLVDTFSSLFPGYLFVAMDLDEPGTQWRPILGTFGVSDLILCGESPAAIPDAVAKELLARADSAGNIHVTNQRKRRPTYRKGADIRVTEGPFTSLIGQFIEQTAESRIALLMDILGRKARVVFGEGQVEAA
jgi:transcriptional antiterminator RfaH